MGKGNFFLLQGRRRGKGLSKSNMPPEVCLWNKLNKASHIFSSSLAQQPNHIPESFNCLLDIGRLKQINTWYFCLLQKAHGQRSQSAHPSSSCFVIWQITQHIPGHTHDRAQWMKWCHVSTGQLEPSRKARVASALWCFLPTWLEAWVPLSRTEGSHGVKMERSSWTIPYPHPYPTSVSVVFGFFFVCFCGGVVWLFLAVSTNSANREHC